MGDASRARRGRRLIDHDTRPFRRRGNVDGESRASRASDWRWRPGLANGEEASPKDEDVESTENLLVANAVLYAGESLSALDKVFKAAGDCG